jgi:hypothetical protein
VRHIGAERSCFASLLDAEAAAVAVWMMADPWRGGLALTTLLELRNCAALVRMATRIDRKVDGASLKDVYLCTVRHNDFL